HAAMRNLLECPLLENGSCALVSDRRSQVLHQPARELELWLGLIAPTAHAQEPRVRSVCPPLLRAEVRRLACLNRLGEHRLGYIKGTQRGQCSATKNPEARRHSASNQ